MGCLIRAMSLGDFDALMEIQALCFSGGLPEDRKSLLAKLEASPTSCLVAENDTGQIDAYLFALPWVADTPPSLNAMTCQLPVTPNCLYLHDLSVHPRARGQGLGEQLVQSAFVLAERLELRRCSLVAVQGSTKFWQKFGFTVLNSDSNFASELNSYGEDACFMSVVFS